MRACYRCIIGNDHNLILFTVTKIFFKLEIHSYTTPKNTMVKRCGGCILGTKNTLVHPKIHSLYTRFRHKFLQYYWVYFFFNLLNFDDSWLSDIVLKSRLLTSSPLSCFFASD